MTKSDLFAKSSGILTHFCVISRHFCEKLHKSAFWRFLMLPWNSKLYSELLSIYKYLSNTISEKSNGLHRFYMFIESLLHVKNQTKVLSQSCENGVADKWTDRNELIRPLRRAKSPRSCLVGRSVITQHPHHSKSDQYSLLCINTNYSLKK